MSVLLYWCLSVNFCTLHKIIYYSFFFLLKKYDQDYQAMVAQLEHQFRLGRLSVQGLWFFCQVCFLYCICLTSICGLSIKSYINIWQRMMSSLNALAVLVEKATSNSTSGSATLNLLQSQVLFHKEFMLLRLHTVRFVPPSLSARLLKSNLNGPG
jgi:hypothetical protein